MPRNCWEECSPKIFPTQECNVSAGPRVSHNVTMVEQAGASASRIVQDNRAWGLRVAFLITGRRDLADEAFQEASRRLWDRWQRVAEPENPTGFFRTLIVNEARRALHRLKAAPELIDLTAIQLHVSPDVVDQSMVRQDLWRLVNHLPARQRAAIVLRYYADLPDRDIAAVLDCREATVRSLMSRALKCLAKDADRERPER